jgi:hypothetical protein
MSLMQKQAWARTNESLPSKLEQLKTATGKEIQIKFNESSFSTPALIDRIPDSVLGFLIDGMQYLCSDALAKEAVSSQLKSIVISHEAGAESFSFSFKDGTLSVSANFDESGMAGIQYPHSNDYQKFLTENL